MGRNGHPVCTREAASSSLSSLSSSFLVTQWWIDVSSSTADAIAASPPFSLRSPLPCSLFLSSPRSLALRSRNPWRARTGIPRRPKPKSQIDQLCSHFHLERDSEGERERLSLVLGLMRDSGDKLASKFAENVSHEEGRPRSSSAEFLKSSPFLWGRLLSSSSSSFHCGAK